MMCDALGLPVKFILTAGQASDMPQAIPLLTGQHAQYVIADKGYDCDKIVRYIHNEMSAISVIPPKANRLMQRDYDTFMYKDRNLIERLFNRLKQFRKIATRFEKFQINFEALIYLACSYIWLL
jgi:transposase